MQAARWLPSLNRPVRTLWALIVATTLLRVLFAASLGLGVDESYTAATARQLELAYFDHPPAAWWLTWGAGKLFGGFGATGLRLPFIVLFALSSWLMFSLTRRLFDDQAAFWAAATLNLAPVLAWTSGSWIVPDGPLNAALLAGARCAAEAVLGKRNSAWRWWLGAGTCGGLALLCKLHGVFLLVGVGLFLLTSAHQRYWLRTPWPYMGAAITTLVFLPVLIWNQQHGWVSFAFQAGRARYLGFDPLGPAVALLGQALYLLPSVWIALLFCLAKALLRGPTDARGWLMLCLGAGPIVTFTAVGLLGGHALPHWAAPGYLMLFPLLGAEVADGLAAGRARIRTWLRASAAAIAILLAATIALAWLPWPSVTLPGGRPIPNPLLETVAWNGLERDLAARGFMQANVLIAATRWHEAGKLDYALRGRMPVTCLCGDPRAYGILRRPEAFIGWDALIIGRKLSSERIATIYGAYFAVIEAAAPIVIMRAGVPALELSVFVGRGLHPASTTPNLLDPLSLRPISAAKSRP